MKRAGMFSLALLVEGYAGCAAPLVDFAAAPPPPHYQPSECAGGPRRRDRGAYTRLRDHWTRHAHVRLDYDTALDGRAVLMSGEMRAGWLRYRALVDCMAPDDFSALVDRAHDNAARGVDFVVLLDSSRWEWNDLSSDRSVWSITFVDDRGQVVAPIERQPLDDRPEMMVTLYGDGTPFTRGWRIRFPTVFPDGTPLLRPDTRRVTLRFAGPLGSDDMTWTAK
jgi:hypothetical protein